MVQSIRKKLNCTIIIVDDSSDLITKKIIKESKIKNLLYFEYKLFFGFIIRVEEIRARIKIYMGAIKRLKVSSEIDLIFLLQG